MRVRTSLIAATAAALLGCRETPEALQATGGVALDVRVGGASGVLQAGRILVRGPTDTTVDATPGDIVTIGGLKVGAYTVSLEGLVGGKVAMFGETSVWVNAGQASQATVTLASFQPGAPVVDAVSFGNPVIVNYSGVPGAGSYQVEWSRDSSFATGVTVSAQTSQTVDTIIVSDYQGYYFRVRAVDRFQGVGTSSAKSVSRVDRVAGITSGGAHTCVITIPYLSAVMYCWGDNTYGSLGDGAMGGSEARPVAVTPNRSFTAIFAANGHTCAVTEPPGLAPYCWGLNQSGEVGDGTITNKPSPVPVTGALSPLVGLSAGAFHSCALTQASGGAAYCWGRNDEGQLGDGTPTNKSTPSRVVGGPATFDAISGGGSHTCGLAPGGVAYCWGRNVEGQLGDGTTASTASPVAVTAVPSLAAISAGYAHTCGLTSAGTAYCWGRNVEGELGDGTTTSKASPVAVGGGRSFTAIAAGYYHTCGLTSAGTVFCWGFNRDGGVGDGTTTNKSTPVAVAGGLTFTAISAGGNHTCGTTSTGAAYCWGSNTHSEVGDGTIVNRLAPVRVMNPR